MKNYIHVLSRLRSKVISNRKTLREIHGPVKENELWRIGRNDELEAIIKGRTLSGL